MKPFCSVIQVLFFLLIISSGCSNAEINMPESDYYIAGKVFYPDGTPFANTNVYCENTTDGLKSDITDALGNYQISKLSSGKHIIRTDYINKYSKGVNSMVQTNFSANIDIGQNNKDFNIMLGIQGLKYGVTRRAGSEPIVIPVDFKLLNIGTKTQLVKRIRTIVYAQNASGQFTKVFLLPRAFTDFDKLKFDYLRNTCVYDNINCEQIEFDTYDFCSFPSSVVPRILDSYGLVFETPGLSAHEMYDNDAERYQASLIIEYTFAGCDF